MKTKLRIQLFLVVLLLTSRLMAQTEPKIVDDEIYVSPVHIMCEGGEVEAYSFKIITDNKNARLWFKISVYGDKWHTMFTFKEPKNKGQIERKDCYEEYPDAWVEATNNDLITEKFNRFLWFGGDKIMQYTLKLPPRPEPEEIKLNVYLCSDPEKCPPIIKEKTLEHNGTIHFPCNDEC